MKTGTEWFPSLSFSSELQKILENHRDGNGADTAGDRRKERCDIGACRICVASDLPARLAGTRIDEGNAVFKMLGLHETWLPCSEDENISIFYCIERIAAREYRDSCAHFGEHRRNGLSYQTSGADHNSVGIMYLHSALAEDFRNRFSNRRTNFRRRGNAINVFLRRNRCKDGLGIHRMRKRKLHNDTVGFRGELAEHSKRILSRGRIGDHLADYGYVKALGSARLGAHERIGDRIGSGDEDAELFSCNPVSRKTSEYAVRKRFPVEHHIYTCVARYHSIVRVTPSSTLTSGS